MDNVTNSAVLCSGNVTKSIISWHPWCNSHNKLPPSRYDGFFINETAADVCTSINFKANIWSARYESKAVWIEMRLHQRDGQLAASQAE